MADTPPTNPNAGKTTVEKQGNRNVTTVYDSKGNVSSVTREDPNKPSFTPKDTKNEVINGKQYNVKIEQTNPVDDIRFQNEVRNAKNSGYNNADIVNAVWRNEALLPSQNEQLQKDVQSAKQQGYNNAEILSLATEYNVRKAQETEKQKSFFSENNFVERDLGKQGAKLNEQTRKSLRTFDPTSKLSTKTERTTDAVIKKVKEVGTNLKNLPSEYNQRFVNDPLILRPQIPSPTFTQHIDYTANQLAKRMQVISEVVIPAEKGGRVALGLLGFKETAQKGIQTIKNPTPENFVDTTSTAIAYSPFFKEAFQETTIGTIKGLKPIAETIQKNNELMFESKKGAVFRTNSAGKRERVSPKSQTQKSKESRQQYYDPNKYYDSKLGTEVTRLNAFKKEYSRVFEPKELRITSTTESTSGYKPKTILNIEQLEKPTIKIRTREYKQKSHSGNKLLVTTNKEYLKINDKQTGVISKNKEISIYNSNNQQSPSFKSNTPNKNLANYYQYENSNTGKGVLVDLKNTKNYLMVQKQFSKTPRNPTYKQNIPNKPLDYNDFNAKQKLKILEVKNEDVLYNERAGRPVNKRETRFKQTLERLRIKSQQILKRKNEAKTKPFELVRNIDDFMKTFEPKNTKQYQKQQSKNDFKNVADLEDLDRTILLKVKNLKLNEQRKIFQERRLIKEKLQKNPLFLKAVKEQKNNFISEWMDKMFNENKITTNARTQEINKPKRLATSKELAQEVNRGSDFVFSDVETVYQYDNAPNYQRLKPLSARSKYELAFDSQTYKPQKLAESTRTPTIKLQRDYNTNLMNSIRNGYLVLTKPTLQYKQNYDLKINNVVSTKIKQNLDYKQQTQFKTQQIPQIKIKLDQENKLKQTAIPQSKEVIKNINKSISRNRNPQETINLIQPQIKTPETFKTIPIKPFVPSPKIPKPNKPTPDDFIIPPLTPYIPRPKQQTKSFNNSYIPYTRVKGIKTRIGTGTFNREEALNVALFRTKNTASATALIEPSQGNPTQKFSFKVSLGDYIRKSANRFIQKNSKRINSFGEKQEITKKGIQTLRFKKFRGIK
jgi:hypothetical protein